MFKFRLTIALCVFSVVGSATAQKPQGWPAKPITIIVSYPAGGDTDVLARVYAEKLSARLGQPVVVDNKPGASGTIGNSYVAKAAPDGHTLLLTPSTFSIAPLIVKLSAAIAYDVHNDFTPVVMTLTQPLFLVSGGGQARTLKELLENGKTKPVSYATPGAGSPMHILGEMFNKSADAKFSHVPYRGVAPAVNDVVGGHVPITFTTWGPVAPHIASGKLTALAVSALERSALAPNVPTFAELGLRDLEVTSWQGLLGPRGMHPEIASTLGKHMNEIIAMPEVVAKMKSFGALPEGGDGARLSARIAADYSRFGKIIKEVGIKAE